VFVNRVLKIFTAWTSPKAKCKNFHQVRLPQEQPNVPANSQPEWPVNKAKTADGIKTLRKSGFWRKITTAMFMLDTISDMFKDRFSGVVKKLDAAGIFLLAGKLAKNSIPVILKIGIFKSARIIAVPSLLTIKGGFEKDEKKERQWPLAPEPTIIPKNIRQTSPCQAPVSRI